MTPLFLLRLLLDLLAACLLLAAMAYNWSGNALHEIMGTVMFALLVSHNVFNRRWYGTLAKGGAETRAVFIKAISLSLLLSMLALLTTSVIISQTVFSALPFTSTVLARQIHTMVAYLALLVAAGHLGLKWRMIMGVARRQLGMTSNKKARSVAIRALAALGAAYGVHSLFEADVGRKLLMQASFDLGNLQTPTLLLLVHHLAIVWLAACVGHYGLTMNQRGGARLAIRAGLCQGQSTVTASPAVADMSLGGCD